MPKRRRSGLRLAVHRIATILLAALLIAPPRPAAAHPHVWIDASAVLVIDAAHEVEAVRIVWRFDEFFSAFAVEELNADGDDEVTDADKEALAQQYIESLVEWHYMTELLVDDSYGIFGEAEAYAADIEDGIITLRFTLPLTKPVDARAHDVALRMYDPTYYIAVEFVGGDAVAVEGPDACSIAIDRATPSLDSLSLGETTFTNTDQATGIGIMFAATARLRCD
jgi:ABC-type uncharacterized transport system substrate-binding protein